MKLEIISPKQALNKGYFRQSLKREEMELFKTNLIRLFSRIDDSESEEHNKNIVSDFLKDTFYKTDYEINTSGRKDLVIHLGNTTNEPVGVIIEAKKPNDKAGMIQPQKTNAKSLHELIHYYLHERYVKNNKEIRNLIITDIYQWYIFDATEFERLFFNNKPFVKTYQDWNEGVLPNANTDWFYQEIAKPFIDNEIPQLECTYFDLREYESIIKNDDKTEDIKLIELYKILSPQHLLKLSHANDSNVLNTDFYNELLHIIGLCEQKREGKKTIERLPQKERNEASLLENTIAIINTYEKLSQVENLETFGTTNEEQLFSVALELCITWLNRILFLKLLEGQLISYNDNSDFAFLNPKRIQSFEEICELFFDVLAVKIEDRTQGVKAKYANIPYLNSSLFEISPLEKQVISMNQLKDRFELPIFSETVLKKHSNGEKLQGKKPTLLYLLEFLDAYDFANINSALIQEQNKTIINASVLGLIFEKINGYKDGSFFTPGYITMYMCRESIRKTVLQKFNTTYQWNCNDFDSLVNRIERDKLREYNNLINSIHICDPAVGSGHFLVSALNEMIAIKSELRILIDKNGKNFPFLDAKIENDELAFYIDDTEFVYKKQNHSNSDSSRKTERQRIQETIFQEKQTIIENCLFGVDINPKSVQICRLRLWIELLKHSYYTQESKYKELETLPNIDINIKCGNSLVSRFGLEKIGFTNGMAQKMKLATQKYKDQVFIYKSTDNKTTRKNAQKEIERLKEQFAEVVNPTDEDFVNLKKKRAELGVTPIFFDMAEKLQWDMKVNRLSTEVAQLEEAYDKKMKSIYGNAFEWRFEFPEILDEDGNFVGFDLVIGNPPYVVLNQNDMSKPYLIKMYSCSQGKSDLYRFFIEFSQKILTQSGIFGFIVPKSLFTIPACVLLRKFILNNTQILKIVNFYGSVFSEASVNNIILILKKDIVEDYLFHIVKDNSNRPDKASLKEASDNSTLKSISTWKNDVVFDIEITESEKELKNKIVSKSFKLNEVAEYTLGMQIYHNTLHTKEEMEKRIYHAKYKIDKTYFPESGGKNIHKYHFSEVYENFVSYCNNSYIKPAWRFCENERILIREITSKDGLVCAITNSRQIPNKSVIIVRALKLENKALLAILNSKLIAYYVALTTEKGNQKLFPRISLTSLKNLPISRAVIESQKPLIKLVDKILSLKKSDSKADTQKLEYQLNTMVYQLYDLTEEEIKIIEGE